MKLLIATRNLDKLREIRAAFDIPALEIVSALDFPDLPEVEEDGATLEENARKKAVTLAQVARCWALADDTGLEVDALDGAPGVYSARYAGEKASYTENCEKLVRELRAVRDRTARFRTVIALSSPSGRAQTVDGVCEGRIIEAPRGSEGFGYDPLFIPSGASRTFAELSLAEKNRISHRGLALRNAHEAWCTMLEGEPEEWLGEESGKR